MEKKSLRANAILNAIKQSCQILFPIISFSYTSHVLGAENIGIYNFSNSIVGYFGLIAALGISTYAIREGAQLKDNNKELEDFVTEVFSTNIISTILAYVLLGVLLLTWNKLKPYRLFIVIQSISMLFFTIGADWVNTLFEDYKYITIRYIAVQIVSILLLLILVKDSNDLVIYTILKVVAESGGMIFNWFYIKRYVHLKFRPRFNFRKHLLPILILFANQIAVTVYVNSDITILGVLTDDRQVGIYSTASRIYNLVKRLVYSVITVALPRFSYLTAKGDVEKLSKIYRKMSDIAMFIAMPCMVGLMFESKNILEIMAGSEYVGGSLSLIILCPAIPLVAVSNLCCNCLIIPRRMDMLLLIATGISAITNIVLNLILIPSFGIIAAAFTTLLGETIVVVAYLFRTKGMISDWFGVKNFAQVIFGCTIIGGICLLINHLRISSGIQLLLAVVLSILAYLLVMVTIKNPVAFEYSSIIKKIIHRK